MLSNAPLELGIQVPPLPWPGFAPGDVQFVKSLFLPENPDKAIRRLRSEHTNRNQNGATINGHEEGVLTSNRSYFCAIPVTFGFTNFMEEEKKRNFGGFASHAFKRFQAFRS